MELLGWTSKSTTNPWLFHETSSSTLWWIPVCIFLTISLFLYNNVHRKGITMKDLAYFNLLLSLVTVVPFVAYAWSGISWTGMSLSAVHKIMIDTRHAVLMGTWSIISMFQMVLYVVGKQSVHNFIGKFVIYILLPSIFLEMFTNALWVFWPEKPNLLYRAINNNNPPTIWDNVMHTMPLFNAITTPITMILYWYLSCFYLQQKKFRLHAIYMTMLVTHTVSVGILRWFIRILFSWTACPQYTENETTMVIQIIALNYVGIVELVLVSSLYTTMTPIERSYTDTKRSFYWYAFHIVSSWVGSAYLHVPSAISCITESDVECSIS